MLLTYGHRGQARSIHSTRQDARHPTGVETCSVPANSAIVTPIVDYPHEHENLASVNENVILMEEEFGMALVPPLPADQWDERVDSALKGSCPGT